MRLTAELGAAGGEDAAKQHTAAALAWLLISALI
jgi:hypothetical protein